MFSKECRKGFNVQLQYFTIIRTTRSISFRYWEIRCWGFTAPPSLMDFRVLIHYETDK